ncbi:hypothetical protein B7H23_03320 [Notoacmeibacter marinus]|uniref:Uncharacterized protein n=1 Tax=Notoacmeibacter marinus TaxID=1876515 RepID=A0A231V1Q6_9HYPH|nr:hypothetical protein [Notoacmeibacter marinus]OXT01981.1 hypothetical protein B7H23_03320 [Notoacmeibacter marinus]
MISPLLDTAQTVADEDEARELVADIATASFKGRFGEMADLQTRKELATREVDHAAKHLLQLRKKAEHTPKWLQASQINDNRDEGGQVELTYSKWQFRHRIEALLLILMMLVTFIASYVTAYSNLMGTGSPVFIETPVAYFMAAMAPLAGFCLKLFGNVFRSDRGHHRFTIVLFSMAVILAAAWALLFAKLYHGLSTDGIGTGLFDEPTLWDSWRDTIFISVTLLTEITLSAALASRLDRIARIYSPDFWHRNPESLTLEQDLKDAKRDVDALTDRLAKLSREFAPYENALDLQVRIAQLALSSRRSRAQNTSLI